MELHRPRLLYITARGHSGSTLLELLLAGHSQLTGLGEIKQLRRKRDRDCQCGRPASGGCPFWSAVDEALDAEGLQLETIDPMHPDPDTFVMHNRALLAAAARVSGTPWLIDSSKSIGRLRRLIELDVADLRVVHLVRRPEGVVASNLRRGRDWRTVSRNYTVAMHKTLQLLGGRDCVEVGYESLARHPRRELARILEPMALSFEAPQLDWARNEAHLIAGNAMRFSKDSAIRLDRRWAHELGLAQRIGIAWHTLPARLRSEWLYEAHLPYWKGEGADAWREYRRARAERIRRERRHRLIDRYPTLRGAHDRIALWWRRVRG